jgi:hypothetical protein
MGNHYVYGLIGLQGILNCSKKTAIKHIKNNSIPHSRIGRKLIFDQQEVLESLKVKNK